MKKPLEGTLVLDFSQFLSGPSAGLRLADLGARVIKIEQPKTGDICRELYCSNLVMNGESSIFHAINRNKESYQCNLKSETEREKIYQLISKADIMIHNFRPGVAERLGIDYATIRAINPHLVYGSISGYGTEGPWKDKPGQDLLVQALSGLTQLSGNAGSGPVPMGLPLVDLLSGAHLVQGILACLLRRYKTKQGGLVEVSMLESIMEFQFESVTTFYRDGGEPTERTKSNNAHAYLGAPYGVYETKDGYIALAMGSIPVIGELLSCPALAQFAEYESWFTQRDKIKEIIANHLLTDTSKAWLSILEPADFWCAEVLDWKQLFDTEAFKILEMIQKVKMSDGFSFSTTRCPIQINGKFLTSEFGSPKLGEHNQTIAKEFELATGIVLQESTID